MPTPEPDEFSLVCDDFLRAANSTGGDAGFHLSLALSRGHRLSGTDLRLTVEEHDAIVDVLPRIADGLLATDRNFLPVELIDPCFEAVEVVLRKWTEPLAVRRIRARPGERARAEIMTRMLYFTARTIELADFVADKWPVDHTLGVR